MYRRCATQHGGVIHASTSSVLALGVLSLAASAGDRTGAWRLLHIFGTPSPDLLVFKVLALLLVLFFAFFCFASSIRLYGHAGFMIGTCSAPGEEERRIHVSAACLEQAARQFHLGMRAFYFLVPLGSLAVRAGVSGAGRNGDAAGPLPPGSHASGASEESSNCPAARISIVEDRREGG